MENISAPNPSKFAVAMSYDEYDQMIEVFDSLNTKTFWPTLKQMDMFEMDPGRWLLFCCYLHEKGKKPKTNEEKYSKKNLLQFINRHLILTEEEDS